MKSSFKLSSLLLVFLSLQALSSSGCSCQREENIEAKKRLTAPVKEDPMIKVAAQKVEAADLDTDEAHLKRVTFMPFKERWMRLGSFKFTSNAKLSFAREATQIASRENTVITLDAEDNFSLKTLMGQGGEQKLASLNGVFYLKNRNGKWRISRDPKGERLTYLEDATAVWPSFYKLLKKDLDFSAATRGTLNGRDVYIYELTVNNQSEEALKLGATLAEEVPKRVVLSKLHGKSDEEVPPDETLAEKKIRMARLLKWRDRSFGGGGQGKLWVDVETGVWLKVILKADVIVGDGPATSTLKVDINAEISEIGSDQVIEPPKEAIAEIARKKWPVKQRERLEKKNIVAPLPKEED